MRRRSFGYGRREKIIFRSVCITLVIATVILLVDARIQPSVYELAALEAKNIAVRKINSAAQSVIISSMPECRNIISVSYGENNIITGITADIVKLNLLKTRVTVAIDEAFKNEPEATVRVPLGTATDLPLLSGQGPYKKVSVGYSAFVDSEFDNIFQSTGINQTEYSILLKLTVDIVMLLPGKKISEKVKTSFCVAQTVIVGGVPKSSDSIINSVNGK